MSQLFRRKPIADLIPDGGEHALKRVMGAGDRSPNGDQRVPFFLAAALACLLLYLPAPPDYRWVTLVLAAVYTVLAGLTALDRWSRNRD